MITFVFVGTGGQSVANEVWICLKAVIDGMAKPVEERTMIAAAAESRERGEAKSVLTTGEVAYICSVAPRTVSKWFDSGQLKGYRIPGSRDRRIPRDELIRFMRAHGIPLGNLGVVRRAILIIDTDVNRYRGLTERLGKQGIEVKVVDNCLAAGAQLAWLIPAVVVINLTSVFEPMRIAEWISAEPWTRGVRLVGLATQKKLDEERRKLLPAGFDAILPVDCDMGEIIAMIGEQRGR